MAILSADQWDLFLERYPDAHLLQTTAWGELKSSFGWDVQRVSVDSGSQPAGAQILFRKLPLGFQLHISQRAQSAKFAQKIG
jgi:lipid II:glycine glycyltransferase (peptidoglycan interpeptide bridge formation enzyme)